MRCSKREKDPFAKKPVLLFQNSMEHRTCIILSLQLSQDKINMEVIKHFFTESGKVKFAGQDSQGRVFKPNKQQVLDYMKTGPGLDLSNKIYAPVRMGSEYVAIRIDTQEVLKHFGLEWVNPQRVAWVKWVNPHKLLLSWESSGGAVNLLEPENSKILTN